jgi:hypothetical protein
MMQKKLQMVSIYILLINIIIIHVLSASVSRKNGRDNNAEATNGK